MLVTSTGRGLKYRNGFGQTVALRGPNPVEDSYTVSTATDETDLAAKINGSTGNQIIKIPEGAFWNDHINCTTAHTNTGWVIIESENPGNQSVLRSLSIENTNYIWVRNLKFGDGLGSSVGVAQCLLFRDCSTIRVSGLHMKGERDDYSEADPDPGNHNGMVFRGVEYADIWNNLLENLYTNVQLGGSNVTQYFRDSRFHHNEIRFAQEDFLRCYKHTRTRIDHNYLHGPLGIDQGVKHGDFIQFATSNGVTSEDVEIDNNIMDSGYQLEWTAYISQSNLPRHAWGHQAIFINDEGGVGYDRFNIHDNVVHSCEGSGVKVVGMRDSDINNNTLSWHFAAAYWWGEDNPGSGIPNVRYENCDNLRIRRNIAGFTASGVNTNITREDNTRRTYNGPTLDGVVNGADYLASPDLTFESGICGGKGNLLRKLRLRDGCNAEARGHGSALTRAKNQTAPGEMEAVIRATRFNGHCDQFDFSALRSIDQSGYLTDLNASFEWDFGDGNTATGVSPPTHTYATYGDFIVTLTVTRNSDGKKDTAQTSVWSFDPQIFDMTFTDTAVTRGATYSRQNDTSKGCRQDWWALNQNGQIPGQLVEDPASSGLYSFHGNKATNSHMIISNSFGATDWIKGADAFTLLVEFRKLTLNSGQDDALFKMHPNGGYLQCRGTNGTSLRMWIQIARNGPPGNVYEHTGDIAVPMNDLDYHTAMISFNGHEGRVKVAFDGVEVYDSPTAATGNAWTGHIEDQPNNIYLPDNTNEFTGYYRRWAFWRESEFNWPV